MSQVLASCKVQVNADCPKSPHNKPRSTLLRLASSAHYHLPGQVLRSLRRRSFGSHVRPRHPAVDDKVGTVHEGRLVARQEQHCLRQLDRFSETAGGEVDLAPVPLLLVIAEPVLQKRSVEWRWAERVEAEALASVNDGEFPGHRHHSALGSGVCELRRRGADECDYGCCVDDASVVLVVLAEGKHGMLATEPNALDVDVVGKIPDLLWGVDGICRTSLASQFSPSLD